jgi:hypothetical protein
MIHVIDLSCYAWVTTPGIRIEVKVMSRPKKSDDYQSVNDPDAPATAPPKQVEPKDVRFRRLAMKRVPAAVKRIGHVAYLANRAQYEYTDEQRDKVLAAINDAVVRLKTAFSGSKSELNGWTL